MIDAPAIPDVIRKNNANFTTDSEGETIVNEYAVTPDLRDDAEGYTQYTATQVASDDFDLPGAIAAIAQGDAEFKAVDSEGQAFLQGIEHAFNAGALFAHLFEEEIEDDPALLRLGFQTYMLAQLALAGRGE